MNSHTIGIMKNTKKTETQKQLIKFRNQLHKLLIKYPEIRLSGDEDGDVLAWTPELKLPYPSHERIYLPKSGKSELIN